MFPECIHEPAYTLSTLLLDTAGKGWADRVFYSDNGSTAVEVAVKMALSKTEADWNAANLTLSCSEGGGGVDSGGKGHNSDVVWNVIGLHGSYHGDTIGAMDLSSPNVYNKQVHW